MSSMTARGALPRALIGLMTLVIAGFCGTQTRADSASDAFEFRNSMIDVAYVEPRNTAFTGIYVYLKKRAVLEEVQEFMSPIKLPHRLKVQTSECGATNSWYEPIGSTVTVCYEWVDWVLRTAPVDKTAEGFSREDIVVGAFVQVVLHELSHAMFDQLNVPLWGRDEDAADLLAGFVMTQLGQETARRTLTGAAYFFQAIGKVDGVPTTTAFADVHGTDQQRFYNYLCVAYGNDPATFQDFVDKNLLPKYRAATCAHEFQQLRFAFAKTIYPYVDADLMKKVQAHAWLQPTDGK